MARKTMAEIRAEIIAEVAPRLAAIEAQETHNENTMYKVYAALSAVGIDIATATEAVDEMQNRGILFRERL